VTRDAFELRLGRHRVLCSCTSAQSTPLWAGTTGEGAGRVIVTVEHPSLAALAQSSAKLQASPEFQKWQTDAVASGIKQLSNSLVTELRW
jgi:hypothetical protein